MPYRAKTKIPASDRARRKPDPRRSLDPKMRALLEQLDAIPYERASRSSLAGEESSDSFASIKSASS
jgi:hypothetical protein